MVKKSLNLSYELAQRIDEFITKNPGVSFTLIANQAILNWIEKHLITIHKPKEMTEEDLAELIEKDRGLMEALVK